MPLSCSQHYLDTGAHARSRGTLDHNRIKKNYISPHVESALRAVDPAREVTDIRALASGVISHPSSHPPQAVASRIQVDRLDILLTAAADGLTVTRPTILLCASAASRAGHVSQIQSPANDRTAAAHAPGLHPWT